MRVALLHAPAGGGSRSSDDGPPADRRLVAALRSRAPLRRALARIAAQMVSTRAWERLGYARLADYARERVGVSARQIQDLAHTSARLDAVPELDGALVAGRIGWSQARLVARVATPDDAGRWIEFARRVSVRALEREVRAVDLGSVERGGAALDDDGEPSASVETILVRCSPRVRAKFHFARQLARRVAGEALQTWACMEAVAAEALSAVPGRCEGDDAGPVNAARPVRGASYRDVLGEAWARAGPEPANVCASHVVARLVPLLDGLERADAFALDSRLRQAVRLEQRLEADAAPWLRAVAACRSFRARGFGSLDAYARERLGISPRKARALVRIERASESCPTLRDAFRSGRLSWVQVQTILPALASSDTASSRKDWIDLAQRVSVRRLADDVEGALATERQTCARATARAEDTARFFFLAPIDVARLFRAVVCSVRRALERTSATLPTEGEAVEWMFDHAFETWGANQPRVRREHRVFARDGWRCTVPGCSSFRNLHDHHVVFRSAGGSDDTANRTTLCAWHHLRGVHAGRVRCTGTAPEGLTFELGLRTDHAPLQRFDAGEHRLGPLGSLSAAAS